MYKPDQTETIESLQTRREDVKQKMIHGADLDFYTIEKLKDQYNFLSKRIEEKKREEVLNA
jgi:hypothetical protein